MLAFLSYIIPGIVLVILLVGFLRGVNCFESFVVGAKEGAMTIVRLLPSLIGLIVAIGVFRASGAMEVLIKLVGPVTHFLGLEDTVLPLLVMRPVSGSASLAILNDILQSCGADSIAGFTASVMMGSTETILYTMAVYMGGAGLTKAPHVLASALLANLFSAVAAGFVCRLFYLF